jgi:hypothetical protein
MTTAGEPKTTRRKTRATPNFEILAEKRLSHRERHEKKVEKRFGALGSTATRRLVKDQRLRFDYEYTLNVW